MKKILVAVAVLIGLIGLIGLITPAMAESGEGNPRDVYLQSIDTAPRGGATGSPMNLIAMAAKHEGKNARQLGLPRSLWCADFVNSLVGGTDRRAISYASRGTPAKAGCVGCVIVTARGKRGYHVGIVTGYDPNGNPITISGNHGHKVGYGTYSKRYVVAYRYV